MPSAVVYRDPENRWSVMLVCFACFGGVSGALSGWVWQSLPVGIGVWVIVGLVFGLIMAAPTDWELQGQMLRVTEPPWRTVTRADLTTVEMLQAVPRPKGGFDAYLVARHGHRILMPSTTSIRGARFRAELLAHVPERALARVEDPLLLELLQAPDEAAPTRGPRTDGRRG